jgi:hypothetical protein
MGKRVTFVHTVTSLSAVFKTLTQELAPDLDTFNIVDESLLQNTIRDGALSKATIRRLVTHMALAQEAGADVVMVTCSSVGPAVDIGRPMIDIPVTNRCRGDLVDYVAAYRRSDRAQGCRVWKQREGRLKTMYRSVRCLSCWR